MDIEGLLCSGNRERYALRQAQLKDAFEKYRETTQDAPLRRFADEIVKGYLELCKGQGEAAERRYRLFAQRYLSPFDESNRVMADREYIHERTAYRDINRVFDELMVLVYGVDGVLFE